MPSINERLDALMERQGVEARDIPMPIKIGNKSNVCAGGNGFLGQRFPVTLYASSWAWFLREENIEALVSFLEDNQNSLSWEK
jgi:hypothetical protein